MTVLSFQRAAILHDARERGTYSVGKHRVVLVQAITLCRPEHPRWRLAGATHLVCGTCHPPPASLEVVWL